jgi:hypothetical protein
MTAAQQGRGGEIVVSITADLALLDGAGDGNRTRMASLEGWGSAIELRPHAPRWRGGLSVPAARSAARGVQWPARGTGRRVSCGRH